MTKCQLCGGTSGVAVKDYGSILVQNRNWDGTIDNTEIEHTRPAPKWGKCLDCGKRVLLSKLTT